MPPEMGHSRSRCGPGKMPRSGRWCSESTSCRMSARRASANWRSECGRGAAPGAVQSRAQFGGHRQYLRSGPHYDFPGYRKTVHEVTQAFAAASREVLAVEAELAGPRAQPLLAGHVRSLQQLEQTRLATVALLQLMGTPELTGQEDTEQMQQLKMKVIKTMEAISEVLQDLRFDAESAE
nr:required for excision 1-B domain-containing protein isoform X3 [Marmota flaviventris]